MTRLPRLLNGSMKEVRRLHPLSLSITEKLIPLSYASMKLMKDEMLTERQWVELFSPLGSVGVFRVKSPQEGIGQENYTAELEHGCTEIGDYLITDAFSGEMTCRQAIQKIFSYYRGSRWKLGNVACTATVNVDYDYDNVLEAIIGVLEQTVDYVLSFNFNTSPWTVSVVKKEESVTAEGRLSRNVQSAVIKRDDTELCTRVYVDGLPKPAGREGDENAKGYMDADTISQYGVVEREQSGSYTESQARRVAQTYLRNHKSPKVSVDISAIDLSDITGEQFDKFTIGKLFRLALPEHNQTVTEIITQIAWSDVFGRPREAQISLGDDRDPVMTFYKETASTAKEVTRSGKSNRKKVDKLETHFEQTDESISMWANKTDINGHILQEAGLKLDANGTLIYATDHANNIGSMFDVTAKAITAEVEERKGEANDLKSTISQMAGKISLVVDDKSGEINSASIVAEIDKYRKRSKVTIKADIIDMNGLVEALRSKSIGVGSLSVEGQAEFLRTIYAEDSITSDEMVTGWGGFRTSTSNGTAVDLNIYDASVSGNTLTIKRMTGGNLTFSKAVTNMNGVWSSGVLRVTPEPQGSPVYKSILSTGTKDLSGKTYTVPIKAAHGDSGQYSDGQVWSVTVNADEVYDNGYDAGYKVTQSQVSGSNVYTVATSAGSSVISGRRSLGSCSRPSVSSYLLVTLSVHGSSYGYYITLN